MTYEFKAWPKIPRLSKLNSSITEKLDGTNAIIHIVKIPIDLTRLAVAVDAIQAGALRVVEDPKHGLVVLFAGSRTRWIQPGNDNFGFAAWVDANADQLVNKLGPGTHYGEWWGQGIQRGYGLSKRYFTLFNPWRYGAGQNPEIPTAAEQIKQDKLLGVVPILSQVQYSPSEVGEATLLLETQGSLAVPGWMKPEGVVIYLGSERYKVVINGDDNKKAGA